MEASEPTVVPPTSPYPSRAWLTQGMGRRGWGDIYIWMYMDVHGWTYRRQNYRGVFATFAQGEMEFQSESLNQVPLWAWHKFAKSHTSGPTDREDFSWVEGCSSNLWCPDWSLQGLALSLLQKAEFSRAVEHHLSGETRITNYVSTQVKKESV